jgi:hypothetical protein
MTGGTLEEILWEVLPHLASSPDVVSRDLHMHDPLKQALGRKKGSLLTPWWRIIENLIVTQLVK